MILVWLILLPFVGGLLAWLVSRWSAKWSRGVALLALGLDLASVLIVWAQAADRLANPAGSAWLIEFNAPWIPSFGISLHLGLDGLSLLLIALTAVLGLLSVAASWREVQEQVGFFHFNLLWVLAGITGVFLALDLFLFYFFWEMMLVPMYFLIALWGHENRIHAAVKFFLFTQLSGLLMLAAILGLYFIHGQTAGVYTFDYTQLLGTSLAPQVALLLMLGFTIAFVVKLPAVSVHTWLPEAHTEAPTGGSVILAGLLLKTGAYGLLRFVVPLFPQAALNFAPIAMVLGVIGILYGALLAFGQTDLKRMVAYTSVSHMGFVLVGIFAWNPLALQGVVLQIIAHGLSTGALFIVAGALQERTHTRDIRRLNGLWSTTPRLAGATLIFALASLGLPGLINFVGEFLILLGAYQTNVPLAILATLGLIAATVYSLWLIQSVFHGENREGWKLTDLSRRESVMLLVLIIAIVVFGLYPQPLINTARPALNQLQAHVTEVLQAASVPPSFSTALPEVNHDRR